MYQTYPSRSMLMYKVNAPPPKGVGFVVQDSRPVPSEARHEGVPPEAGSKLLAFHAEVPRPRLPLVRDVLRHDLVGHVAAAAAEIPSRPQVPPPELLP